MNAGIRWKQNTFILDAWGRIMPCSCVVKRLEDETRPKWMVVRTMPGDVPYSPQIFPVGMWEVYSPRVRTDDFKKPFFIPTDAWQMVPTWHTEDRAYTEPTGNMEADYGYGLHCSTSRTTLGCIRIIEEDDLLWLVERIRFGIANKEAIYLEVTA